MIADRKTALAWLEQWRSAAPALAELRRRELAAMSEAEALRAADALLEIAARLPIAASRIERSGLVELQDLLHRRPRR